MGSCSQGYVTSSKAGAADQNMRCSFGPWSQLPWLWGPVRGPWGRDYGGLQLRVDPTWKPERKMPPSPPILQPQGSEFWQQSYEPPERTSAHRHLSSAWWDPGQGIQQSRELLTQGNREIVNMCCFKPLFAVICYATDKINTVMMMSFEGLRKRRNL